MIDLSFMTNFKHKANFTLSDASNLKTLDIPSLVAKRSRKKHVNIETPSYQNKKSQAKSQAQTQND